MSYWIYFKENPCKQCGRGEELDSRNMTSNVSGMWGKALGKPMRELHKTVAGENAEILEKGINDMYENYKNYTPMNPSNGWGSVESARDILEWMLQNARDYPESLIEISS